MGRHILVPVDGSEAAENAFEHALDQFPDATLTLVHVVNPLSSFGYGDDEYFDYSAYEGEAKRQRERGEDLLEQYRTVATDRGFHVETLLSTGQPSRKILEAAESSGVDQIVMGSTGRSAIGRVLFGSVAESVTRRATVPVTIVR